MQVAVVVGQAVMAILGHGAGCCTMAQAHTHHNNSLGNGQAWHRQAGNGTVSQGHQPAVGNVNKVVSGVRSGGAGNGRVPHNSLAGGRSVLHRCRNGTHTHR